MKCTNEQREREEKKRLRDKCVGERGAFMKLDYVWQEFIRLRIFVRVCKIHGIQMYETTYEIFKAERSQQFLILSIKRIAV